MKTYTVQCWLWCVLLHSELYGHLVTCRSVVVKDRRKEGGACWPGGRWWQQVLLTGDRLCQCRLHASLVKTVQVRLGQIDFVTKIKANLDQKWHNKLSMRNLLRIVVRASKWANPRINKQTNITVYQVGLNRLKL